MNSIEYSGDRAALRTGPRPFVMVLGTAQDGGFPQAGCQDDLCNWARKDSSRQRLAACLAIVDPLTQERWLVDCTPSFPQQLHALDQVTDPQWPLSGIFLTHAHIGHYVGLVHLGKEVMGAQKIPVHVMPRMGAFIQRDAPWKQLVTFDNIRLEGLKDHQAVQLNQRLSITPFLVPHRDEISETVGFLVTGPGASVMHIPDIDSWAQWEVDLAQRLAAVDVAFLDGTFFDGSELPHRALASISHPFLTSSIEFFQDFPVHIRNRIRFTHLNHSNPAVNPQSQAAQVVRQAGHHIASDGEIFLL
jgi:pyrroloquinoline quinone biosynthesis protein B